MLLRVAFNRRSIQNPSANRQKILEKCSFRSDQNPRHGFRVPRSNRHRCLLHADWMMLNNALLQMLLGTLQYFSIHFFTFRKNNQTRRLCGFLVVGSDERYECGALSIQSTLPLHSFPTAAIYVELFQPLWRRDTLTCSPFYQSFLVDYSSTITRKDGHVGLKKSAKTCWTVNPC